MQSLVELITKFFRSFQWWVTTMPWEETIRVRTIPRMVPRIKHLRAGWAWKFPFIDHVFTQSVRMRFAALNKQTLTLRDGRTLTISANLGYRISDIGLLYQTLHHAEDTLQAMAKSAIAEYIANIDNVTPAELQKSVNAKLAFEQYGISDASVELIDFAMVRTYRLIGDQGYGGYGSSLQTEHSTQPR